LLSLVNFPKWPENQILIPDWTCFHCPAATLTKTAQRLFQREGLTQPRTLWWEKIPAGNVLQPNKQ